MEKKGGKKAEPEVSTRRATTGGRAPEGGSPEIGARAAGTKGERPRVGGGRLEAKQVGAVRRVPTTGTDPAGTDSPPEPGAEEAAVAGAEGPRGSE